MNFIKFWGLIPRVHSGHSGIFSSSDCKQQQS